MVWPFVTIYDTMDEYEIKTFSLMIMADHIYCCLPLFISFYHKDSQKNQKSHQILDFLQIPLIFSQFNWNWARRTCELSTKD
jgi:D-alanyl-lipoteichoic acid acyltransferase DltB (MBOAT superfamily)